MTAPSKSRRRSRPRPCGSRKMRNGINGVAGARLHQNRKRSSAPAATSPLIVQVVPQPCVGRLRRRRRRAARARGDRDRAEDVEGEVLRLAAALAHEGRASGSTATPTGMLTKKIHSQPRYLVEDSAGEHADRGAGAAHCAPDSERPVLLGALFEGGGDDRERGRRDERRADPPEPRERRSSTNSDPARPQRNEAVVKMTNPRGTPAGARAGPPRGRRGAGSRRT